MLLLSNPTRDAALTGLEDFAFEPAGGSPWLILVLTAWLLYRRLGRIPKGASVGATAVAAVLLGGAAASCLWSHYVALPQIQTLSLCLLIFGLGTLLGGARGARVVMVPACFVVLAYTPPGVLINQIVYPMQLGTASATSAILEAVGISARQAGDLILTGGTRIFQVIETCSGLRGTQTLLMSSVIYAEVFHRKGARALTLVLVSPLLGVLVNEVRVLSIIINPYARTDGVHTLQGILTLVFGVLSLAVVDWLFGRFVDRAPAPAMSRPPVSRRRPERSPLAWSPRLASVVALLVFVSPGPELLPRWQAPRSEQPRLFTLPADLDGWKAKGMSLDAQFLGSVQFSDWIHRRYEKGSETVEVFIGSDDHLDPRFSIISAKTAILGSARELEWRGTARLADDARVVDVVRTSSREGRTLAYRWYPARKSVLEEAVRAALGLDRSPFRRALRSEVIRISTPIADPEGRVGGANDRLQEFASILERYWPAATPPE